MEDHGPQAQVTDGAAMRAGRDQAVRAVVLVAHGGTSVSTSPTSATQLAVLRMVPVAQAIRQAVRGSHVEVLRPRFTVRGWNDSQASPVADLDRLLDGLAESLGQVPVILVGHSMGARAALRAGGHPLVTAVAGLGPWLPPGEPVAQLAGRRILLAHATDDTVTRPADTWAYAQRARAASRVTAIEVRGSEHAMLRRASVWHQLAAEFTRAVLGLPAGDQRIRQLLDRAEDGADRFVV
jgi:pimeloyl-ACP methyl ester carboxylesterase